MIFVCESAASYSINKALKCPKCNRGKLANIPDSSEAIVSRRGNSPPIEQKECVQVKCNVCGSLSTLTIS